MKKAGVPSPVPTVTQSDVLKVLGISTNDTTNGESSTTTCDINGEANSSEQTSGEVLVENGTKESVVLPETEGSQSDTLSNSTKDLDLEKNESSKSAPSDVKPDDNATEEVKEDNMDISHGEGNIDEKNSDVTTEKTDDVSEPKEKKESKDSSNAEDSDNDNTSNSEAGGEY